MSLFKRLVINSASIYAARIFDALLQLVLIRFILHHSSKEYYAAALMIVSLQSTFEIVRGSVQKATIKFLAEYAAIGEREKVNGLFTTSTLIQAIAGCIALFVCVAIAPIVYRIFAIPLYMQSEAIYATYIMGVGIFLNFSLSPWQNYVAAYERYDLIAMCATCGRLVRAIVIFSFLILNFPDLISIVLGYMIGIIFERLACIPIAKRMQDELSINVRLAHKIYFKNIINFSAYDFLNPVSSILFEQGTYIITTHFISLTAVAGLGIIGTVASLLDMVMTRVTQMIVPVSSRLNALNDTERLELLVTRGTLIIMLVGGIIVCGIIPWMDIFLYLWLGKGYAWLVYPGIIMIFATFLQNSITCFHGTLAGIGKVAVDASSKFITTIIGLIAGFSLAFFANTGLTGLVCGLCFGRFLRYIFINIYGMRVLCVRIPALIWNGALKTYAIIAAIWIGALYIGWSPTTWPTLLMAGIATGGLFFLLGIFWILNANDRCRFARVFKEFVPIFKEKYV